MDYFSDREKKPSERNEENISNRVWAGLIETINCLIDDGSFGFKFPKNCPDGSFVCGTDEQKLSKIFEVKNPNLCWPLKSKIQKLSDDGFTYDTESFTPETAYILDLIEFCFQSIGKPIIQGKPHDFFSHHHFIFNEQEGREEFKTTINGIFSRNNLAYELKVDGKIQRLVPTAFVGLLNNSTISMDSETNALLSSAVQKIKATNLEIRREALEKLWDCWERVKSLDNPNNKKASTEALLNKCASEENFRNLLEAEAKTLTEIGNKYQIRHTEKLQIKIQTSEQVDYLFYRLFSLIHLLTRLR